MNITKELSDSLLAACRMANIAEPKYIAQDADGSVCHYRMKPIKLESIGMWADNMASQTDVRLLNHPTYTYYWRESLIELVDHVADTSKKVDDACEIAYQKHLEKDDDLCWSRYRQGWLDALAWKAMAEEGGCDQARGIEALVCDDIAKRQQVGIAKYGTTVAGNPLTHAQWLQHAYEECLDMAVYLKRAMAEEGGASE
jgi:hypothetical protein